MIRKELIVVDRVRKIDTPFGWVPHRFISEGYIKLLMYFFLSVVSDKLGLSYYGDKTMGNLLGINYDDLKSTRELLQEKGFIAYKKPFYQVLPLPLKQMEELNNGGITSCKDYTFTHCRKVNVQTNCQTT